MPAPPRSPSASDSGASDMTRTYAWVIVVEVLVVLGLWAFSRYFG